MTLFDFAAEYDMFPRGGLVLCAVSGGADSMYLLSNLLDGMAQGGYRLAAAHYNHRLRGSASNRDAGFVQEWCMLHGVTCIVGGGDVAAEARARGAGLEETARDMRYAFLELAARQLEADVIATAHTADDNAETLLLNLVRGSGLQGLCGIPPRRGNIVRPMLGVTRAEVEQYLAERGVPHMEDESNQDLSYARNRVRHQVMPVLRQLNPRTTEHMADTIARLRQDNDVLSAQAARVAAQARPAEGSYVIACKEFDLLPDAVALRALRRLIQRAGGENVTAAHLEAVKGILRGEDPSAMVHLPDVLVQRVYSDLLLTPRNEEQDIPLPQAVHPEGATVWGRWTVTCRREPCPERPVQSPEEFWLAAARVRGELTIRARMEGDELKLRDRPSKTIKKWMIDEKVPRILRETLPVLADEAGVAAAATFGPEESRLAEPGEDAYHIKLEQV